MTARKERSVKNLFSVDRTEDIHSNRIDETPFCAQRISTELESQIRQASNTAFEAFDQPDPTRQGKRTGGWQLGVGLLLTVTALIAAFVGGDALFSKERIWLAWLLLAVLVAGGVLVGWSQHIQRKAMKQEAAERKERHSDPANATAFENALKELQTLQRQAREQLGVPSNALELDIFPFMYRKKGGEAVSMDKRDRYQSMLVLAWRRGDALCLSDGSCTLSVPQDAIRIRVDYDRPFTVDMWLKNEQPDEGRFKPYHLKRAGILSVKGQGLHGLQLTAPGGDSYELLIPDYDLPQLEKLVTLPPSQKE